MKIINRSGIMITLLTVSEDRATLRSDLSAGTEVSGKSDAARANPHRGILKSDYNMAD